MKKRKETRISVIITGIICLTILEAYALYLGFNGVILTSVIAVIAGICGWSMPQLKLRGR